MTPTDPPLIMPSAMEPMRLGARSRHLERLTDLSFELKDASDRLRYGLPKSLVSGIADLVRSMNCYYSNLIEGHDTHPADIERALADDYSTDPEKRDLQREARAYISVQSWLDAGDLPDVPTSEATIRAIHARFYQELPEDLRWVQHAETDERSEVIPGSYRERGVRVGRLDPVPGEAIPRMMARFDAAYRDLGQTNAVLAVPAAHHRLLWIHPFLDGNGRVARLMTHAMLGRALNTGNIWSAARGLARADADYKQHLQACDGPRRGDHDGRGALSEAALAEFSAFFLETCLDQVRFMEDLVEPGRLRARVLGWARREIEARRLPPKSDVLLGPLLNEEALARAEIPRILDVTPRHARRVVSALRDAGIVAETDPALNNAPYRLAFPATLASDWMPGLFPPERDSRKR